MKKVIGITGGIASGKSNVCRILKSEGYLVIDADEIYTKLSLPGGLCYQAVLAAFGSDYINKDGTIAKKKLGQLIFHHEAARLKLNAVTHPLIQAEITRQIALTDEPIVFVDIPLLYEAGFTALCDRVIVVYLDRERQIKRLMERDHIDRDYALVKIGSQMDLNEKKALADYVIDSSGSFEQTQQQVKKLIKQIKEKENGSDY